MFQLLSTRDANPPVFSLSFTVTDRPPTTVTCSVNGNSFTISDNDLIHVVESTMDPINVTVTVIVRMRVAGMYYCTISNERTDLTLSGITDIPSTTTPVRNITGNLNTEVFKVFKLNLLSLYIVTDVPTGLMFTRTAIASVLVSWSAPVTSTPSGYEVFVINTNDGTSQSDETTDTQLLLTLTSSDTNYTVLVVAYGEDLPSESISVTIPNGKFKYCNIIFKYIYY